MRAKKNPKNEMRIPGTSCSARLEANLNGFAADLGNGSEAANSLVDLPSIPGDERKTVVVQPVFNSVTFSGDKFHAVTSDAGGAAYTTQQWLLGRQKTVTLADGTTIQADDSSWPVCYTRSATISLSSGFVVPDDVQIDPPKIKLQARGQATAGTVTMKWTHDLVNFLDHSGRYAAKASDTALADTVQDLKQFQTAWEVSGDDGVTWHAADSSSVNHVYVTLGQPDASPLYETVVYIGCKYALGETTALGTFNKIWEHFKGLKVERADGTSLMKFWVDRGSPQYLLETIANADNKLANYDQMINPNGPAIVTLPVFNPPPAGVTKDSLRATLNGVGTCNAWADLFYFSIVAQDQKANIFVDGTEYKVETDHIGNGNNGLMGVGFDIKDSLGSQSNPTPVHGFTNHAILIFAGKLYDPSYGKSYPTQNLQNLTNNDLMKMWEDASVGTFLYLNNGGHQVGKPNTPQLQTKITQVRP